MKKIILSIIVIAFTLPTFAQLNMSGTDYKKQYMYYCKKFLCKVIEMGGHQEKIYNTSSKLTLEEMTEFLNKIKVDAATELGITLPLPEDRFFEQFYAQFNY